MNVGQTLKCLFPLKMPSLNLDVQLKFYKDEGGTGGTVCTAILSQSESFHYRWGKDKMGDNDSGSGWSHGSCENDEISSMIICNARKGFALTVFDDGSLTHKGDDYATVLVKTNMKDCLTIRKFELSETYKDEYSGDEVEVKYKEDDNLKGKISSMEIHFEGII